MLDLSTRETFFEFMWYDKDVIRLPKPPEEVLRSVAALQDANLSGYEQLQKLREIVLELLRKNENGRVFSDEEFERLDCYDASEIMKEYIKEVELRLGE